MREQKLSSIKGIQQEKDKQTAQAGKDVQALKPELHQNELSLLLSLQHPDPHSILGAHLNAGGVVLRALRPDATTLSVIEENGETLAMSRIHPDGLFESWMPGRHENPVYQFELTRTDGTSVRFDDPYRFLPTWTDTELHRATDGRHERLFEKLGGHPLSIEGTDGVAFSVWAPNASGVSVVGESNDWDPRLHAMRVLGSSGIWEIFVPGFLLESLYKFEIRTRDGKSERRADPFARRSQIPPQTSSVISTRRFRFWDREWFEKTKTARPQSEPLSIYEMHFGSWRRGDGNKDTAPNYREMAAPLTDYILRMGFTHVEFMPLMEHPFGGSWGYQVSGYYSPTARYGYPDDLRYLIDTLHRNDIGVILDWVPAHFPRDNFALGRFDGTALFEYEDPRQGEHPDWGTLIFNYGRTEVRNFLISNALFWLDEFHADGLRIDAVASMLYLDYSRKEGEWIPNVHGGRENLEAMAFIRELNEVAHAHRPGAIMIAEESTAWPGVSRPTYTGGLGFGFKWNMGWMHDTLEYFSKESVHRRFHHDRLTAGLLYAFSENYVLPFSHDEVVHGKGSMIRKMPGDRWQKFANLRSLYAYMWAHPGKKLLFMGSEFAQDREWNHDRSLDWNLLEQDDHAGVQKLVADLNRVYRSSPALWRADGSAEGFQWLDASNSDDNVVAFLRRDPESGRQIVCVGNFSPMVRYSYRLGLPRDGEYKEILNTDSRHYGGSNVGNQGSIRANPVGWHGQPFSAEIVLPPLSTSWFEAPSD